MSADNWTKCPNCRRLGTEQGNVYNERIAQARKAQDFNLFARLTEQKRDRRDPLEDTLREDWELYIDGVDGEDEYGGDPDDGATVTISYSASCDVCGFSYSVEFRDAQMMQPGLGRKTWLAVERTGEGSWKHEGGQGDRPRRR